MDDQPPRSVNTNAYVGTSSNPGINFGTSSNPGINVGTSINVGIGTNNNMAMVTQPPQEQGVTYGYGYAYCYGYQYGYPQQYPPRYENAGYPEEPSIYVPPPLNLVVNQGHYGHPGTYQFQPSTSQPQHHSYHHQELQFQQPQPQRSHTGSRSGPLVLRNDYNLPGFVTRYANAKFFVIKSWNKEHVLHSIRHRVWTSTWRGNLKLNAAYAEAISSEQSVQGGSSRASRSNCPIFLLFSVNTSGHFCGVAEMVGPVDFGAKAEFWDWVGIFPVKWRIIKDVPFKKVFHIIVESNENRSIIFSRDVQQVEKEKGEEMLCRFKKHVSTTSLLDEIVLPAQRRMGEGLRRPASATHNEDQEREVQHERQQKHQVQEEDDNAQQETDHKNEQEKQETNHKNAQEIEGGESQDNGHTSNNKNKIQEEETDHNDSRENQQIDSIVITVTCSNIKEEKIDHNNARESERGENNRTESSVIKLISHSSSNNGNKQEDETDTNKQEEETDGKIKREPLCLENQEKDSTVIRLTSHSSNYNNNAQEFECGEDQGSESTSNNNKTRRHWQQ